MLVVVYDPFEPIGYLDDSRIKLAESLDRTMHRNR